jgi:hypothetical protein
MTYELWDLTSRNLIDWFSDRQDALEAIRAYVGADEADQVELLIHADGEPTRSITGAALEAWAEALACEVRRSA